MAALASRSCWASCPFPENLGHTFYSAGVPSWDEPGLHMRRAVKLSAMSCPTPPVKKEINCESKSIFLCCLLWKTPHYFGILCFEIFNLYQTTNRKYPRMGIVSPIGDIKFLSLLPIGDIISDWIFSFVSPLVILKLSMLNSLCLRGKKESPSDSVIDNLVCNREN